MSDDCCTTIQIEGNVSTTDVVGKITSIDLEGSVSSIDLVSTIGTIEVNNFAVGLNIEVTFGDAIVVVSGGGLAQYPVFSDFPATGEPDVAYVAKNTGYIYRWTGSAYSQIGDGSETVWGSITGAISDQADLQSELNLKADKSNVLGLDNETVFTPVADYEPSTKKYVDDQSQFFGTRAEIFALVAPKDGLEAFATDTEEEFIYYNGWQQKSTLFKERTGAIDAGSIQNASRTGYNKDSINGKHLSDITIGSNRFGKEGGARTLMSQSLNRRLAQFFLDGGWQTVLTGVNIATDTVEGTPDIEFTDFSPWVLSLITGNSDALDLEGMPTVQKMKTSAGSRQLPMILDGGTF